jgi:hypothetical protein
LQRYFCKNCKSYFQSEKRPENLEQIIFYKYVNDHRTLKSLAKEYSRSIDWVRSKIAKSKSDKKIINPDGLVIVADVTFFRRIYGYIVFRSPKLKKNLYFKQIPYETIMEYSLGRAAIESRGFKISAIVLDGKPGVRSIFSDIPVQMCHFHQKQIIQRYLTNNPKLEAGIELKKIANTLCDTDEKTFAELLKNWHEKWIDFLKEKTVNPISGRWHYTHRRIRSAYRSLNTNLPYLFIYKKYPELDIPNTTNSLDGSFSHLKGKLNIHRGLREPIKKKIIEHILNN